MTTRRPEAKAKRRTDCYISLGDLERDFYDEFVGRYQEDKKKLTVDVMSVPAETKYILAQICEYKPSNDERFYWDPVRLFTVVINHDNGTMILRYANPQVSQEKSQRRAYVIQEEIDRVLVYRRSATYNSKYGFHLFEAASDISGSTEHGDKKGDVLRILACTNKNLCPRSRKRGAPETEDDYYDRHERKVMTYRAMDGKEREIYERHIARVERRRKRIEFEKKNRGKKYVKPHGGLYETSSEAESDSSDCGFDYESLRNGIVTLGERQEIKRRRMDLADEKSEESEESENEDDAWNRPNLPNLPNFP